MTEPAAPYDAPATPWDAMDLADLDLSDLADLDLPDLATLTADDFTDDPALATQRYHVPARPKFLHLRKITYEHAREAAADLFPLAPGERVHALVNGSFLFGDLIEAAAVTHDWLIDELWIATLTLSEGNLESLANLFAGDYLRHLHIVVSDYWIGHEKKPGGLLRYAWELLDQPTPDPATPADQTTSFQLASIYHHAKITLIATAAGGRYVIHGSANMRSTGMLEVFTVEHDADLYDWHRVWMAAIEADHATINHQRPHPASKRSTSRSRSWQQIQGATAPPTTPVSVPATPGKPARQRAPSPAGSNSAAQPAPSDQTEERRRAPTAALSTNPEPDVGARF